MEMNKLKELENKIEELGNLVENLKREAEQAESNNPQMNTRWRARGNETYYYFYSDGEIAQSKENCESTDTKRYNLGNYFKTEEEAENVVEKIKIYTQLKDLALRLNKGVNVNWRDCRNKYSISYDTSAGKMVSYWNTRLQEMGQIYCLDSSFLDGAIKEIGEENLKKLFK